MLSKFPKIKEMATGRHFMTNFATRQHGKNIIMLAESEKTPTSGNNSLLVQLGEALADFIC